jgi:hypothetical protein
MMRMRNRARTGVDLGRLASAMQRPGADPRVNLSFGLVALLGFDTAQGIFADVKLLPTGEIETCFVASGGYAGPSYGVWGPLQINDMVLVALPNGDPNAGPTIIARIWNGGAPPHEDFKSPDQDDGNDVPSNDYVIRVQPGQNIKVRVSDSSGDNATQGGMDFKVEGDGTLNIETDGSGAMTLTATGDGPITVEGQGSGDVSVNQSGSGNIVVHQSGSSGDVSVYSDNGVVNLGAASGDSSLKGLIQDWDTLVDYLSKNQTLVNDLQTLLNQVIEAGSALNVVGEAALINTFSSLSPNTDPSVPSAPGQSSKVKSTNS